MTDAELKLKEIVKKVVEQGLSKDLALYIYHFPEQITASHLVGACRGMLKDKELRESK